MTNLLAFREKLLSLSDFELNRMLAKAIGWEDDDTQPSTIRGVTVGLGVKDHGHHEAWRAFDYKDWGTIGPIAERYDAFPNHYSSNDESMRWASTLHGPFAPTPQKAIAFVVVERAALSGI